MKLSVVRAVKRFTRSAESHIFKMLNKKTFNIVRKFLKKAQAWVDKTPGVISVSVNVGDRDVVLAEKKR